MISSFEMKLNDIYIDIEPNDWVWLTLFAEWESVGVWLLL